MKTEAFHEAVKVLSVGKREDVRSKPIRVIRVRLVQPWARGMGSYENGTHEFREQAIPSRGTWQKGLDPLTLTDQNIVISRLN